MDKRSITLDRFMWRAAYVYITLPFIIFLTGWLRWYYALIAVAVVTVSFFYTVKVPQEYLSINMRMHRKKIVLTGLILLAWVFFSGIGGYTLENEDFYFRNAILKDLIDHRWPVVYDFTASSPHHLLPKDNYLLVYYFGFWMPSALVGKMFGLQAANFFLFLWTTTGIVLTFYFICRYLRKYSNKILLFFILFSGMDIIPTLFKGEFRPLKHIEWWSYPLQYSSNSTLLYWVFNQTVVPWLVVVLLLNKLPLKNMLFVAILVFFYAPFPFIGLLPFIAYFILSPHTNTTFGVAIKNTLSFQNTIGAAATFLILLGFYTSNFPGSNFNFTGISIVKYLAFILFEFLCLALILFKVFPKNALLIFSIILLLVFPFIQFRQSVDFTMRASIPALFVLMIFAAECVFAGSGNTVLRKTILVLFFIGTVTSLTEIGRSVYLASKLCYFVISEKITGRPRGEVYDRPLQMNGFSIFDDNNPLVRTFVGPTRGSFFYTNFCKQEKQ